MKTFEHKKDVVSMFGLIGIIVILNLLRYVNGYGYSMPVLILTIFLTIMVVWMWMDSSYIIENQTLRIKNGPFSQKVDINQIEQIKSGKPSIFGGKLAKFKLTISYKKRKLNVFPIDKEDFIKSLLKINSKIKVE
jgi:hypothetical protein